MDEEKDVEEQNEFTLLPTGKPHISFSEMSDWIDCTWRHKKKHIDHIDLSTYGVALDNGTAVHASSEDFLRTRVMKPEIATKMIKEAFEERSKEESFYDYIRFDPINDEAYKKLLKKYKGVCEKKEDIIYDSYLTMYVEGAEATLADIPEFMDETFGDDWEFIDAEHKLYEEIKGHNHAFKGYIDGIIKCKGKRGKYVYWLLDWKTTSWGWKREKKEDAKTKSQLILYKNFWSEKMNINPKDIRCGFVLLKRDAKPGKHCELLPVSVGNVTTRRTLDVIDDMFASIERKMFIKNKTNCKWCDYKGTEHCSGTLIT